jgi:hypothetical protein
MSIFNQLKLVHKLLGLCLVAFLALGVVTAVAYRSLRVSDVSGRLVNANAVQRSQMDGDMMHDAIRADVALCAVTKDPGEVSDAVKSLGEHAARGGPLRRTSRASPSRFAAPWLARSYPDASAIWILVSLGSRSVVPTSITTIQVRRSAGFRCSGSIGPSR